ncbi:MAG: hypothetical protein HQ446_12100 [Polaromonas sp.]|nr:hypothetical protein [Polaromonas sp.]
MSEFATVEKLVLVSPEIHSWALDSPANTSIVKATDRGLYIQGWILTAPTIAAEAVIVRFTLNSVEIQRTLALNSGRPDVIQRVLGLPPSGHAQLRCGYAGHIPENPEQFSIGVSVDSRVIWLCNVMLGFQVVDAAPAETDFSRHVGGQGVIQGTDGWLFLDNDTNHSVDQHTGRLRLDSAKLSRWRDYLDKCNLLAYHVDAQHAVLIAPSKEQVLPEHYPFLESHGKVLDQVLEICAPDDHVLNAGPVLSGQPDKHACFIKTDTHWTDRGAMLATLALIDELSLDAAQAHHHFSGDVYHTMNFVGDLGIKLTPPRGAPTEFLRGPTPTSDAAFDNLLPNIGRVLLFESGGTLWPHSLLMFGASSAYPMLKYLKRLFSRLLFVHSAANVDAAAVKHEKPDFLVMQTTARFMVEPPHTDFCIRSAVITKLQSESEELRHRAVTAMGDHSVQKLNLPYRFTELAFQ